MVVPISTSVPFVFVKKNNSSLLSRKTCFFNFVRRKQRHPEVVGFAVSRRLCVRFFFSFDMSKVDKKKAAEAKDKGNKFFLAKQYSQAIEWYTKAVQADPTDAAFYSNRAAAYMGMNKFEEALADSEQCIKLMPNWVKVRLFVFS